MSTLSSPFHKLPPENRGALAPLFAHHPYLRTIICAVLQAGMGTAVTDDPHNPHVAILDLGFYFFGGDATHPAATALIQNCRGTAVVPNHTWRDRINDIHGDHVRPHLRTACDGANLSMDHLQPIAQNHPDRFRIQQLDHALARQIREDVTPDLIDNFGSVDAFMTKGFGFAAVDEQTGRIACGASTYAVCGRDIEIEIDTHPDYRRLGLATAVSATLIIYCLQHNIHPHWDAHNPTSARLAQRLGYNIVAQYETYRIPEHT